MRARSGARRDATDAEPDDVAEGPIDTSAMLPPNVNE